MQSGGFEAQPPELTQWLRDVTRGDARGRSGSVFSSPSARRDNDSLPLRAANTWNALRLRRALGAQDSRETSATIVPAFIFVVLTACPVRGVGRCPGLGWGRFAGGVHSRLDPKSLLMKEREARTVKLGGQQGRNMQAPQPAGPPHPEQQGVWAPAPIPLGTFL